MKTLAKILLAALGYVIGTALSGVLAAAVHLPTPSAPPGTVQAAMFRSLLLASVVLIAGIAALASGLGGSAFARFAALFLMIYVCVGVNTLIEAAVFTTMMAPGLGTMFLHHILPSAFAAAALAASFGSGQPVPALPRFSARQWSLRLLSAWIAFPVIYWVFGMCVAPFVMSWYRAGVAGLRIPTVGVILQTELLRSALYLLAALPVILLWAQSRARLFISLGIGYAVMVGLFGLLQATWLPPVLRIVHSIEITADSFAYAAALVLLLTKRKTAPQISCMQPAGSFRVEG